MTCITRDTHKFGHPSRHMDFFPWVRLEQHFINLAILNVSNYLLEISIRVNLFKYTVLCRSKDARWTPGKGAKVLDDCIGDSNEGGGEELNDKAKGDNDRDRGGRETKRKNQSSQLV